MKCPLIICWAVLKQKNHPNADLADLRLSDSMIEFLKSELVDNSLLCELATHPDFPRLMADPQLRQFIAVHIDDDSFCRYIIQQDINKIALDLREAHKDDFFSAPEQGDL